MRSRPVTGEVSSAVSTKVPLAAAGGRRKRAPVRVGQHGQGPGRRSPMCAGAAATPARTGRPVRYPSPRPPPAAARRVRNPDRPEQFRRSGRWRPAIQSGRWPDRTARGTADSSSPRRRAFRRASSTASMPLVGGGPVQPGHLGRVHVMTMRLLRNTGGVATRLVIGLSMPSIRRRRDGQARLRPGIWDDEIERGPGAGPAGAAGSYSCCPTTSATLWPARRAGWKFRVKVAVPAHRARRFIGSPVISGAMVMARRCWYAGWLRLGARG